VLGGSTVNRIKTALLLGLLSGVLLLLGERLGGGNGLVIGLGLAVAMNFAG
jgi:heat shock protein HtpX